MLILSQDKNGIVNLTNITSILAENKELIARVTNGHKATLGEYNTEERAKEVLQEIMDAYSHFIYYNNQATFIMPKE